MATFKFLLRRSRSGNVFLIGLVSVSFGAVLTFTKHAYLSAILLSVGSSIMSTVLVWLLTPANEEAYEQFLSLGITKAYPSRDRVESVQWVAWLRSAKRTFVMLGTSHSKWCTDPNFRNALEDRLRSSVEVKVFFLDPTKSAVRVRAREEDPGRDTVHEIKAAIRALWMIRSGLLPELQSQLHLYVYEATPTMGVTWIDDRLMIASHILAGSMNVTSPCLLLEPGRYHSEHEGLYEKYADNVKLIETKFSTKIEADNIHAYMPQEQH